jgi:formamidopyrimidine-DNA glycosylase
MPELPEVETVRRGLEKALLGKRIEGIKTGTQRLRRPFPAQLQRAVSARVERLQRRAKYLLLKLDINQTIVIHLGMSGRLVIHPAKEKYTPAKHDHFVLTLQDGAKIVFNDARRFGLIDMVDDDKLEEHKLFSHLGPEPLEKEFSAAYLAEYLKGKKISIKLAIMDQKCVVGVGNIYASEALYRANISPKRAAKSLKKEEIQKLVPAIQKTLQDAIKAGGSSLRDYVQADGELGYFQHKFNVYDRAGEKCKKCGDEIKKLVQGGRSTFYCPTHQK